MKIQDINKLLAQSRDQKFRKKTDGQLEGINKRMSDPTWHLQQQKGVQKAWNSDQGSKRKIANGKKISKWRQNNVVTWSDEQRAQASKMRKQLHKDPKFRKAYEEGLKNRNMQSKKVLETNKRLGDARRRKLQTPDGLFESMKIAAEFYGIGISTMSERIRKYPDKYQYIGENRAIAKGPRKKK